MAKDSDFCKQLIDNLVGDKVLKMVANTLAHNVRPFDTVSRWGGEEFVGIMANVDRDRLFALADRLRVLVEQSALGDDSEVLRVTVSMGGALATPGDTPETLIKRADELMYRSKDAGRNQVSID